MKYLSVILIAIISFCSCKKETTPDFLPGDKGSLEVEFDNIVGSANLQLNTGSYTNAAGEAYSVSTLKYYISNIRLKTTGGKEYVVPKDSSYFLIDESAASQIIELDNVPAENYSSISFTVGVDSLKSVAPASERTGVLDPAGAGAGMYWNSTAGYIFLKMEGNSPASTNTDKKFNFHIGGYSSAGINNIKNLSLVAPGGAYAMVRKNKPEAPHIHIMADLDKLMKGSTVLSIATHPTVAYEPYSVNITNNYAGMFRIDHIHND